MQDYIRTMRRHFGTSVKFAEFLGVAEVTVKSWCLGKRSPRGAEARLLKLLGMLRVDAPELFDVITGTGEAALPVLPVVPVVVVPVKSEWDDAWWYAHTVTRAEEDDGMMPREVTSQTMLDRMTDKQHDTYWDSAADYKRRTGRVVPYYVDPV